MKFRNWCFTSFEEPTIDTASVHYYIYQKERAPSTDRDHWQGYIEFKDVKRMSEVKKVFNNCKLHLEQRKGTQEQAILYCSKEETRVEAPVQYGMPKQQGNRSDIDALWESISQGHTAREVLHAHGGTALRYINAVVKALEAEHEVLSIDSTILKRRSTYASLRNASEVAGNTGPQPLDGYFKYKSRKVREAEYEKEYSESDSESDCE